MMNVKDPIVPAEVASAAFIGSNLANFTGNVSNTQILTNNFTDYMYHRRYVAGGAAFPKDNYRFFHIGIGDADTFLNNATLEYPALECDVNLEGKGGQLIAGLAFFIAAIEIEIVITNHAFTTPFAGDNNAAINPLPDAAAELAADNMLIALRENLVFTMYNDRSKKMESGSIACFPAAGGQFGYTGTADGVAQNGGLSNRGLSAVRSLVPLQNFYGQLQVCRAITVPAGLTFSIQPKLVGLGIMAS